MGDDIQVGSVVKLRSGGLSMTVVHVELSDVSVVHYTDGRFCRQRLPREAIVLVPVELAGKEA